MTEDVFTTWELKILPFLLGPTESVSVLLEVTTAGHGQLITALLCTALRVEFDGEVDCTRYVDFILGRGHKDTSVIPQGLSRATPCDPKTRRMGSTRLGTETKGRGLHGVATSSGDSAARAEPRPARRLSVEDAKGSLKGPCCRRSECLPPGPGAHCFLLRQGQKTGLWRLPGFGDTEGGLPRGDEILSSSRRSCQPRALDVPQS